MQHKISTRFSSPARRVTCTVEKNIETTDGRNQLVKEEVFHNISQCNCHREKRRNDQHPTEPPLANPKYPQVKLDPYN